MSLMVVVVVGYFNVVQLCNWWHVRTNIEQIFEHNFPDS